MESKTTQPVMGPELPPMQGPALPPVTPQEAPQPLQPAQEVSATVDPFIRRGQSFLTEAGFNPGPVDGLMGPKTSGGISEFQTAQGLPVTGQFDSATRGAIANFQLPKVPTPNVPRQLDLATIEQPEASDIRIQRPQPTGVQGLVGGIESYIKSLDTRIGELREQSDPTMRTLQGLLAQPGEESDVLQREQDAGLPQLRQHLTSIQGQISEELASLRAGQDALADQGDIRVAGTLSRRQEQLQRQSTNRVLALQASAEVLQGNIANAENYIGRLAQAETENQRNRIEAQMFNLEQLQRREEQLGNERTALQAEARQLQLGEQLRLLDEQAEERTSARQIALEAIPRGADPSRVASFLAGNPTVDQAIAQFGQALQTPTEAEALELQTQRQDLSTGKLEQQLIRERITSERDSRIQQTNEAFANQSADMMERNQKVEGSLVLADLARRILDSPGLNRAVGPNAISRGALDITQQFTGDRQEVLALIDQLVGNQTLSNLDKMKGVLTDKDIKILEQAATTLGNRKVSVDFYRNELNKVIQVAQRAIEKNGIDLEQAVFYGLADPNDAEFIELIYGE